MIVFFGGSSSVLLPYPLTLKLHAGCLFIAMLQQLACSDCYILGFALLRKSKLKV